MNAMTEELLETPAPVQEATQEPAAPTPDAVDPKPAPKKRGPKPKIPPATPPVVEAPKRKRRSASIAAVKLSKGEKAIADAVSAAQIQRVKAIAECAKVIQIQGAKKSVLDSVDWQIAMLTGAPLPTTATPQAPGYPVPPQYPQPPAYPTSGSPRFIPPSMREPSLPIVPQAGGGAIEGIVETQISEEEDQFLSGGGIVGGNKGWV